MSTDHDMDDLLRSAGERWRAADPGVATPDFAAATPAATRRRARWLMPAAAAAVLVVAVTGGAVWLGSRTHHGGAGSAGVPSSLTGINWTVSSVSFGSGTSSAALPGPSAKFRFNSNGTFDGNDGVNSMSGPVRIDSTTMHFGDVRVSAIGTTDAAVGRVAATIDLIVRGDATWVTERVASGNQLVISKAGVGAIYLSDALPPPIDPSRIRGTWVLTQYEQQTGDGSASGGAASSGGGAGSPLDTTVVIGSDGSFKVQHQCYADSGKVAVGSGYATWSDVQLDGSVPCPTTVSTKEQGQLDAWVDTVLSGATTWSVDGARLTITKGKDSLGFTAVVAGGGAGQSGGGGTPAN